jgi:hypothetical protein
MESYPTWATADVSGRPFVVDAQTSIRRHSHDGTVETLFSVSDTQYADPRLGPTGVVAVVANGKDVLEISDSVDHVLAKPNVLATIDGCRLALGTSLAFCSTPSAIFAIDLAGGAPAKVRFEVTKSKAAAPFGAAFADGDTLFVASKDPSPDSTKHVLRALKGEPAVERLLACGRDAITSVAFDSAHVVFSETGKGVFVVPR